MGEKRKTKVKVVFDTSVWISVIIGKQVAETLRPVISDEKHFQIFMSNQMLSEFARVLTYPKIQEILGKANVEPRIALGAVIKRVSLQSVREGTIDVLNIDPSDNRILECAIHSRASYIVSGDPHLLGLKQFSGIKITTAKNFLNKLHAGETSE